MSSNRKARRAVRAIAKGKGIDEATPRTILAGYVTAAELSHELGIAFETLKRWNRLAIGPPFTMVGRQRLYRHDAVMAWLRSRERQGSVELAV